MNFSNISDEYILSRRKELGLKLKEFRKAKHLTMDELGEKLGFGKSNISKIEAGKWNLGIDLLIAFSVVLEFDINLVLK